MKRKIPGWLKLVVLAWMVAVVMVIHSCLRNPQMPQKVYGVPQIVTYYVDLEDRPITQILHDEKYIYIMADSHNGYVQVYDLEGQYAFTISFYDYMNGAFDMAMDTNTLYVHDVRKNVYVFQNGEFREFIEKDLAEDVVGNIDFGKTSERYTLRMGSVWRTDVAEPICVIQRSAIAFIHQYYLNWVLLAGFMALIGFIALRKKKPVAPPEE